MKLRLVDPEFRVDLSIATAAEPIKFAAIFRRVGRQEQKRLLGEINGWDYAGDPDGAMKQQENLIVDLLIRFEDLPLEEDEDATGQVSGAVKTLMRSVVERRIGEAYRSDEVNAGVEELLQNDEAVLRFESIVAVLDDPLFFTKTLNAAMRSVMEAGLERSKN